MPEITDLEPHVDSVVLDSGNIYVGRKHAGKKVYVYFLKEFETHKDR